MPNNLKITLIASQTLTGSAKTETEALIKKVLAFDHTAKEPYLNNQFNYFPALNTFFRAFLNGRLVGLATLYADEAPGGFVDITLMVDPDQRRQGIGRLLQRAALAESHKFGYQNYDYVCEQAFLDANPDFLASSGCTVDPIHEWQMQLDQPKQVQFAESLQVTPLTSAQIPELLPEYLEAFGAAADEAGRYLNQSLKDDANWPYVLLQAGRIMGYCSVDVSEVYYLFSLFIKQSARNQGLGQAMVSLLCQALYQRRAQPFQLAVESDNPIARHVYEKAGFQVQTTILALNPKSNKN